MKVLLPDDLQRWTDARAAEGGFDSGGDYVRDLLRRDGSMQRSWRHCRRRSMKGWHRG